jgi:hypothetical protein
MGGPKLSDEEALHWLPPGWTEETYANATDEDWEGLSDEVSVVITYSDRTLSCVVSQCQKSLCIYLLLHSI